MPGVAFPMPLQPRFGIYAHPWALIDHGVETALDELTQLGVDTLQLALSYHVASFVTPRNPRRRVYGGDDASVNVRYEPAATGFLALRPTVNERAARALPDILAAASERGIRVIAWLVYLYSHDLARRHPEAAIQNAFGDRHPGQLCPSSLQVREYVDRLTLSVVALRDAFGAISGLHAESLSFLPWNYGLLGLKSATQPGERAQRELALCFCRACRSRAAEDGLDADATARFMKLRLGNLGNPRPESTESEEMFEAYSKAVSQSTVELNTKVRDLAAAAGIAFSTNAADGAGGRTDDGVVPRLRELVDEVRVRVPPKTTKVRLAESVAASLTGCRPGTRVFAQHQIHLFTDGDAFLDAIVAAEEAGIHEHRIYEHSVLCEEHLAWIRRARERVA